MILAAAFMVGFLMPSLAFNLSQAGKTLSVRKWQAAFSPEGYLDIGRTLSRIHRGVSVMFMACGSI